MTIKLRLVSNSNNPLVQKAICFWAKGQPIGICTIECADTCEFNGSGGRWNGRCPFNSEDGAEIPDNLFGNLREIEAEEEAHLEQEWDEWNMNNDDPLDICGDCGEDVTWKLDPRKGEFQVCGCNK